ncbi:hypothetical protein NO1_1893, partial [Candidatus Termititenax aidoneus]
AARSFKLPFLSSSNKYYLRVQALDHAGNAGGWKTLLEYRFDNMPPEPPLAVDDGLWHNSSYVSAGSWAAASDSLSGIKGYWYYWGKALLPDAAVYQTGRDYSGLACGDGDGVYYLYARAEDNAGNLGDWRAVLTYRYDDTPPGNSVTNQNIPWTNAAQAPAFNWNAAPDGSGSGTAGYYIYWGKLADGQSTTPYITAASYTPLACASEGIYYLRIRPQDAAGNDGVWQTVAVYHYDASPPGSSPSFDDNSWTNVKKPDNFIWEEAQDGEGSGIDGYSYSWSTNGSNTVADGYRQGNTVTDRTYIFSTLAVSGIYHLRVRARDAAGNDGAWKTVYIYRYDGAAPGVSATNKIQNWTGIASAGAVTWSAAPDTGGSGVAGYYRYWGTDNNGKNLNDYKNGDTDTDRTYNPSSCLTSGVYYLRVAAVDNAGNAGDWQTVLTYKFDDTPPGGSPTSIQNMPWSNAAQAPAFSWSAAPDGSGSGTAGYYIYWGKLEDGQSAAPYVTAASYTPPACGSEGTYYLRIRPQDAAGNAGVWQTVAVYHYDASPPGSSPSFDDNNWTNVKKPEPFTWEEAADGSGSGIDGYSYNWSTNSENITASGYRQGNTLEARTYIFPTLASSGIYYLRVRARDAAGNDGAWKTVYVYRYDNAAPGLSPTDKLQSWTAVRGAGVVTWSAAPDTGGSGIAGYYRYWGQDNNGKNLNDYKNGDTDADRTYSPPPCSVSGIYYLRVAAVDNAGNAGDWQTVLTYQYDATPPVNSAENFIEYWSSNNNDRGMYSWVEPNDYPGSGVRGYNVYWGTNSVGTGADFSASNSYDPPACDSTATYYLRVQAVDNVGNAANWITVLTYIYSDNNVPGISPTFVQDAWTSANSRESLTWAAAPAGGYKVVKYYYYWGKNSVGSSTDYFKNGDTDLDRQTGLLHFSDGDGVYYYRVQAEDESGQKGDWTTVLIHQQDKTAPILTDEPLEEDWTGERKRAYFAWSEALDSSAGIAGYNVYWGGNSKGESVDFQIDTYFEPPELNTDGIYYLRVQPVDKAGNKGSFKTLLAYKLDITPPDFFDEPVIEPWTREAKRSTPFTWEEALDGVGLAAGSGVAAYNIYWGDDPDGSTVQLYRPAYNRTYTPPACKNGDPHYLRVQAVDNVGNVSEWRTVLVYNYDNLAPDISPTAVTENWTNIADRAPFTWEEASDGRGSGVNGYYVYWGRDFYGEDNSAAAYQAGNQTYNPPLITEGTGLYYLRVRAADNVGLAGEWTTVLTYYYDETLPYGAARIVDTVYPPYTNTVNVSLALTYGDAHSGVVSMNIDSGADWLGWEAAADLKTVLLSAGDGEKIVTVQYHDAAGNDSLFVTAAIILDTVTPGISATAVTESWTNTADREVFAWTPAEDHTLSGITGYYVYWGDAPDGVSDSYQSSANLSFDPPTVNIPGAYYLRTQAVSLADNYGDWTTVLTYQYAGQAPEPVSAAPAEIFTSLNTYEIFTWPDALDIDGDLDGYYICWTTSSSGESTANYQNSNSMALPEAAADGVYYLRVQPVDAYANAGAWRTVLVLVYDTLPPTGSLRINTTDTEYTSTANVYLHFQYGDLLSGVVSLNVQNGGVWQGWGSANAGENILLPLGDGEKTVTVQYRDAAGNLSAEYTASIILDTTLPSVDLPPDGPVVTTRPPTVQPDTDGDGYTDAEELKAGSDPSDPNSIPV